MIQRGMDAVPIEVKAEENLKSKSLQAYVNKFQPAYAVRTSMSGAKEQEWMVNVPLWAVQSV